MGGKGTSFPCGIFQPHEAFLKNRLWSLRTQGILARLWNNVASQPTGDIEMKRLFVSSLLLFASLAAFAEAPQVGREELLKRAQAALDEVSKGPQIWTAKIREAPDYGIQADNFSFDEGGDEGTFYLKFPGK